MACAHLVAHLARRLELDQTGPEFNRAHISRSLHYIQLKMSLVPKLLLIHNVYKEKITISYESNI